MATIINKYPQALKATAFGLMLLACASTLYAQRPTSFVDPYIGSGSHGHVFIGANVPFGGVQVGTDNFYKGWDWCSGYNNGQSTETHNKHTDIL